MAQVLLYAPHDFTNVCVIARTLECLGIPMCFVFDPHRLIRSRYGKSYSQRLRTVSAGAFFKVEWRLVTDPFDFIRAFAGRRIAAVADAAAPSLYSFSFLPSDLLVFGSEREGLSGELQGLCDAVVTIPLYGQTESLNLAVAVGIILAEATRQILRTAEPPRSCHWA